MDFNKLNKIIFATNPSYVGGGELLFVLMLSIFLSTLEGSLLKNMPVSIVVWSGASFVRSKSGNVKGVSEDIISKIFLTEKLEITSPMRGLVSK